MIARYARTLRHLKPWQVAGRIVAPLRRWGAAWRVPSPPSDLEGPGQTPVGAPNHDPWNARTDILEGTFCLLNKSGDLGRPVDWAAQEQSLLWRFTLHYFNYLHLLEDEEQVVLCREWIEANPVGAGVAWHPYPTSLRLVNWCRSGLAAPDVLESLYQQAAYLYRNVETHVQGNHLLENARALVMAGCYLDGQGEAEQWRERGLAIYRDELDEQVLANGFHFERSPMYHALVLEGILDVLNVLSTPRPVRTRLREAARAMTDALVSVTHPDGTIALFNDSTQDIAPATDRLLAYARQVLGHDANSRGEFSQAGYYVQESDDLWLMIDGGPGGPEYLMAHAHADVFSYELSLFGDRIVVDGGVYEYSAGPMRQYVRGTGAHNTVQVDGADQFECWDSFRVARRAPPKNVVWEEMKDGAMFRGQFDGYQAQIGNDITHCRRIEIDKAARSVRVFDTVTGTGTHRVESRVRLHPEVEVSQDGNVFFLKRNGNQCTLEVGVGDVRRETGLYCPRFGIRHRICVFVIGGDRSLPVQLSYEFRY